jgi:hypothetical protein
MSTDKYRLSKYELDSPVFADEACTIPIEFINLLLKHKGDILNLRLLEGKLVASLKDGTVMYSTLFAGDYRNLDDMFPDKDTEFEYVEFPNELKPVLDRHINFLKSVGASDRYIEVLVAGNNCTITSKDKEHGELEEQLELSVPCERSFSFHVNPAFWKEVCSICNAFNYSDGMILFLTERLSYLCREAVEV